MKLTNNRFYFDYNATSPLQDSVKDFLEDGDFDFLNPSSIHQSGQLANSYIFDVRDYLYQTFSLDTLNFNLLFHSGATEGINTIISGRAKYGFENKKTLTFFYFASDHPSVLNQVVFLELMGHKCVELGIESSGEFDLDKLIEIVKSYEGDKLLNFTYVHNLTGVVWSLADAVKIKKETGAFIHVDAVQSLGKIKDFEKLSHHLDAYTFSGHKFGALKGIGFSFIKKSFAFSPLVYGGGQEGGMRSGTSNVLGIYSLKLAMTGLMSKFNFVEVSKSKEYIEKKLIENFSKTCFIAGTTAKKRNANTINCLFKGLSSNFLVTAFDMAGVEVSSGPACSSNTLQISKVHLAMGIDEKLAAGSVRFSFSPFMNLQEAKVYYEEISKVIKRLLSDN